MDLISQLGYRHDSPYKNSPYLDIHSPEGLIDMSATPHDLIGVSNLGEVKKMKAGMKNPYQFKGDVIREIPVKQQGGLTREGAYKFLFEDDDRPKKKKEEALPEHTAPSEQDIVPDDSGQEEYEMAMQVAMSDFSKPNSRFRNPYASNAQPLPSNQNAKYAFNYYVEKGLQPHIAAGIVGNLMHESGLNPTIKGDSGLATGIAQWHPDRFSGLMKWAGQRNKNPYALDSQLDYILEEPGEGQKVLKHLSTARNAEEAAIIFSKTYERPGVPAYHKRIGYAKSLYPNK